MNLHVVLCYDLVPYVVAIIDDAFLNDEEKFKSLFGSFEGYSYNEIRERGMSINKLNRNCYINVIQTPLKQG